MGFKEEMDFPVYLGASSYDSDDSDGEIASEIQLADTGYGQGRASCRSGAFTLDVFDVRKWRKYDPSGFDPGGRTNAAVLERTGDLAADCGDRETGLDPGD